MATSRREKISSSSFARSFSWICASPFSASKKQDLFTHLRHFKSLHLDDTWNFAPRLLKMTEKNTCRARKRPTSTGTRQMGKIRDSTVYKNFFYYSNLNQAKQKNLLFNWRTNALGMSFITSGTFVDKKGGRTGSWFDFETYKSSSPCTSSGFRFMLFCDDHWETMSWSGCWWLNYIILPLVLGIRLKWYIKFQSVMQFPNIKAE